MEALIEAHGLMKRYSGAGPEVCALNGIDLTVTRGEFAAIVGRSGSGKSTLMNILGCLDVPTEGSYLFDGQETSHLTETELAEIRNREIGFVFQGFNLIPNLDALENVELPLLYRGLSRDERRRLSLDALEQVGLGERIHHRPSQMSGGQQQRVAIARAIAARPPLILADEPTGNLDSQSGAAVMDILKGLHREGRTILLITHDDTIAAGAGRIIRIRDGRIAEDRATRQPA